jgi:hypothetical protein
VIHEPIYQPTREPVREPPAAQAVPEPGPAEVGVSVEPQPPLPSSDPKEGAAVPAKPRRPRVTWSMIIVAAGLFGLALGFVLVPRATRKEPSRPPALVPLPSATVTVPQVVSPTAPPEEPTPPSVDQEPEHVEEPAAVVPDYVPPSRMAPTARTKPSAASSKAAASKRVPAKATAASRRGKNAAKNLKPHRWR